MLSVSAVKDVLLAKPFIREFAQPSLMLPGLWMRSVSVVRVVLFPKPFDREFAQSSLMLLGFLMLISSVVSNGLFDKIFVRGFAQPSRMLPGLLTLRVRVVNDVLFGKPFAKSYTQPSFMLPGLAMLRVSVVSDVIAKLFAKSCTRLCSILPGLLMWSSREVSDVFAAKLFNTSKARSPSRQTQRGEKRAFINVRLSTFKVNVVDNTVLSAMPVMHSKVLTSRKQLLTFRVSANSLKEVLLDRPSARICVHAVLRPTRLLTVRVKVVSEVLLAKLFAKSCAIIFIMRSSAMSFLR